MSHDAEERRHDYTDLVERITKMEGSISNLVMLIQGNGDPGIIAKLRKLELWVYGAVAVVGFLGVAKTVELLFLLFKPVKG